MILITLALLPVVAVELYTAEACRRLVGDALLFPIFFWQMLVFLGIAIVALGAAWWVGSHFIVKPARSLVQAARAIAAGHLDARCSLPPETGEFGEIGVAFNQMAEALNRRIAELDEVQTALRQAREDLESRVERRTQDLRRVRERLVDAIENIDAGFAMFGADERLVICNKPYRQMLGIRDEILTARPYYEEILHSFVHTGTHFSGFASPEKWVAEQLAAFRKADGQNVEQRVNGGWFRISDHRMRDGGVVSLRTDVTTLKEIKENLLLRDRAIAALNSGLVVTDPNQPDNPMVDVNFAFEQITGYSKDEVLGVNCRFLQCDDSDPETLKVIRESIRAQSGCQVVLKNQRKDGGYFWNELKISPVLDDSGVLTHWVGIITDVTERVQAQRAAERTAEELRRSNEELERFAYVASHDLQEPLRMVASYTQLLSRRYKDKLDDAGQEFIGYAVEGASRMQAFIRDLLQYSRVGTHGRPFERVQVAAMIHAALENLRFLISEQHAEVTVGEMPTLNGDPVQITQLFQNLIGNSLKFHGDEPTKIKLSSVRQDGFWELAVQDNGIGIRPEDFERIFVIFQRLHSRQEYEGTGIGLAVCKRIVERHGGRIWVTSEQARGCTFHFTLLG